jgi:hypothetical protein
VSLWHIYKVFLTEKKLKKKAYREKQNAFSSNSFPENGVV